MGEVYEDAMATRQDLEWGDDDLLLDKLFYFIFIYLFFYFFFFLFFFFFFFCFFLFLIFPFLPL